MDTQHSIALMKKLVMSYALYLNAKVVKVRTNSVYNSHAKILFYLAGEQISFAEIPTHSVVVA